MVLFLLSSALTLPLSLYLSIYLSLYVINTTWLGVVSLLVMGICCCWWLSSARRLYCARQTSCVPPSSPSSSTFCVCVSLFLCPWLACPYTLDGYLFDCLVCAWLCCVRTHDACSFLCCVFLLSVSVMYTTGLSLSLSGGPSCCSSHTHFPAPFMLFV